MDQRDQNPEILVGELAAGSHVDAEVGVLLLAMAHTERVRNPAAADQVQHTDLLGEPHRIP